MAKHIRPGKLNPDAPALRDIKCFVLDMDGTINLSYRLLPGAMEFIECLQEKKIPFYFFTNNSSNSTEYYVEKTRKLGLTGITLDNIMTSGDVMIHYLKTHCDHTPRIYLAGTPPLEKQFLQAGIVLLPPGDCAKADFAVLGFDTTLNYEKIDTLCTLIADGVPFMATNIDKICPLDGGAFLCDCGSMCRMITHATGVEPKFVGKPFAETADYIADKTGIDRHMTAMVGDRLYTDIKTAAVGGMASIAVLSGEIGIEDVEQSDVQPDYLLDSVYDIYKAIKD